MQTTYTTCAVARLTGVHPNTVRLYEALGLISAPARKPNGYRVFTPLHVAQMRLARAALRVPVLQGGLRKLAIRIIHAAAACDTGAACVLITRYEATLACERQNALEAARIVRDMLAASQPQVPQTPHRRSETAALLGLSIDQLRGWEMNGLLTVRRHMNGYRVYSDADVRRLRVIRALRCANYSLSAILRLLGTLAQNPAADPGRVLDTPAPHEDVVTVCDRLVTSLEQAKACAQEMRQQLAEIEHCKKH
jgi:DNA-binding transcriptional MerR regulator